jgi:IS5 family transposase
MKAHFGVDSRSKLIHAVAATPANVANNTVLPDLLHGAKPAWGAGDQAYRGQQAVIRRQAPRARDFVNRRYAIAVSWTRSSGRKIESNRRCGPKSRIRSGSSSGLRLRQAALSRAQKEHSSAARSLCARQSVHRAPASIALRSCVICLAWPPLVAGAAASHQWGHRHSPLSLAGASSPP